jgi:cell division protein FtsL
VQNLAGRVGLALVVIEEDAWRSVQLAHHNALRAVDDEGTGVGHQRNLAEIDFLLLNVAHHTLAAFARVVDHELRGHLDRGRVGHSALTTFFGVVLRLLKVVTDEHKLACAVVVLDRKHAAKDRLQTNFHALVDRNVDLKELIVGRFLDIY